MANTLFAAIVAAKFSMKESVKINEEKNIKTVKILI